MTSVKLVAFVTVQPVFVCFTLTHLNRAGVCSFQAVCEEIRSLGPKVGLHHDGVVFGSDDFCASIGSYFTF